MRLAGLWLLALALAVVSGCAAGSSSAGVQTGSGGAVGQGGSSADALGGTGGLSGSGGFLGSGGSSATDASVADASVMDASADVAGPACALVVQPLTAQSLDAPYELPTPPGTFRFLAHASPEKPGDSWAWTVIDPNGNKATYPISLADASAGDASSGDGSSSGLSSNSTASDDGSSVLTMDLLAKVYGSYSIQASLTNRPDCPRPVTVALMVVEPQPTLFSVRVFPPAATELPAQEFRLQPEELVKMVTLQSMIVPIGIFTNDESNQPLPSFLQITGAGSNLTFQANTLNGQVKVNLLRGVLYDLLLIPIARPQDPVPFAPKLLTDEARFLNANIVVDRGMAISGRAVTSDDQPVPEARVVLRAGARPSTIGISDSAGAFTVYTRPGTMSAEVTAPASAGLPDVFFDAAPGVVLGTSDMLSLTMRWAPIDSAPLSLVVRDLDGTTPMPNATVHVELAKPMADAAQLLVQRMGSSDAGTILKGTGSVHWDSAADPTGTARFAALPTGDYRVTVVPSTKASPGAAITGTAVTLPRQGLTSIIQIAHQVTMQGTLQVSKQGTLQPAASSAGTTITAIDSGTDVVTSSQTVMAGSDGTYQLVLNPGRRYTLWASPPAGTLFARSVMKTDPMPATGGNLPILSLMQGVTVIGKVTAATDPIANALLQIYCPPASAVCLDTTLPIAEAVSDSQGSFKVILPDVSKN